VNLGRRWYLVAWDCDRDDWRTFRVDRIERPQPAGARFAARSLPGDADPAAYVAANLRQSTNRFNARITVHAAAETLAEQSPWLRDSLTPLGEATCEYRTSDDSLDWLAMRVGMLGVDFDVHEPPELVERMGVLARRFERAAGA
jgi:predicted DNA-binding transcriptional regulator YafY